MYTENISLKRIKWIDGVKGFLMLIVLVSHSMVLPYIGKYMYAAYMQIFFVLSGYVLKSEISSRDFICKRAKQLLIPYFTYNSALSMIFLFYKKLEWRQWIEGIWGYLYGTSEFWVQETTRGGVGFQFANNATWFLTAMFLSSVLAIPLLKYESSWRVVSYIFISFVLYLLPIRLIWNLDIAWGGAVLIYMGNKLKRTRVTKCERERTGVYFLFILFVYIVLVTFNGDISMPLRIYGNRKVISLLMFFIIGIVGEELCRIIFTKMKGNVLKKFLIYIGQNTITILCTHLFFIHFIRKCAEYVEFNCQYIVSIVGIIFSLINAFILRKIYIIMFTKTDKKIFLYL